MRRFPFRTFMAVVALHLLFVSACGPRVSSGGMTSGDQGGPRDAAWAQPVEVQGVPNLHRVTGDLYRSAQPTAQGMQHLEEFGIRTVINLRSFHSDDDKMADTQLDYVHIPMHAWHPEEEDIIEFLRVTTDEDRGPVLVHCNYGADRTGFMCALYRIVVCGWSKEKALAEMVDGGFGFHSMWRNLAEYRERSDIDALHRKAGPTRGSSGKHVSRRNAAVACMTDTGGLRQ